MSTRAPYGYAMIEKSTNRCFQTINTATPNWVVDDDYAFSVPINPEYYEDYLDKYYYDNQWWERIYDTDEEGNQLETYVDVPYFPPIGDGNK